MQFTDDFNSRKRLSKRYKKFQEMIIIFNNVLSFINENAKMNEIYNVWITFRIMKLIHHMLNAFLIDSNDRRRFCRIYSFDFSQKILLKRLIHDEQLFEKKFHELQKLMFKYNSYAQSFKNCDDRLKNDDFEIKFVLKQHDFKRMSKNTHNKFIFDEIVVVLSVFEMFDSNKSIERNIVMQIYDDDFIRVFYWHFCYMTFRYFLLFSCEKQNWMFNFFFLDHENSRDFRIRKILFDATFDSIQKHDQKFDDDENEKFARDQNEKNDDNDVRIEKKSRNEWFKENFIRTSFKYVVFDTFRIEIRFLFQLIFFLRKFCHMFCFLHISKKKCENHFFIIKFLIRQIVKSSMTISCYSCFEFQQRIFDTIQRVVKIFITM